MERSARISKYIYIGISLNSVVSTCRVNDARDLNGIQYFYRYMKMCIHEI